jgi:hypothetical protein
MNVGVINENENVLDFSFPTKAWLWLCVNHVITQGGRQRLAYSLAMGYTRAFNLYAGDPDSTMLELDTFARGRALSKQHYHYYYYYSNGRKCFARTTAGQKGILQHL